MDKPRLLCRAVSAADGTGLCILYLAASLDRYCITGYPLCDRALLLILMTLCMTALEYLTGLCSLRLMNVRLWDYRDEWGNIQGIICPKFTAAWALLAGMYCFLIHPYIGGMLDRLSQNPVFSFSVGLFFGVFIIDAVYSVRLVAKLKAYAEEKNIVVKYEAVKARIRSKCEECRQRYRFFRPFGSGVPLHEILNDMKETMEQRITASVKNDKKKGEKNGKHYNGGISR